MSRPQVLVCEEIDASAMALLESAADVTVKLNLDPAHLKANLAGYTGVLIGGSAYMSASTIEESDALRVIGSTVSHLDRIDVTAARDYGVEVVSAPSGNAVAVAEQVLMMVLRLSERGLSGKTLGLVGYGPVSLQVANRARAFNMRVIVNQPRLTPELALENNLELLDLEDLLAQSDFVSLHMQSRDDGPIIGSDEIALMPDRCSLINLTSPGLVDAEALIAAIDRGSLANAAVGGSSAEFPTNNPNLIVVPRPEGPPRDRTHRALVQQMIDIMRVKRPSETLSLDIVPIELVMPHEEFDQKRVDKLKASLDSDGMLANPPLVTKWAGRYVILDGATRFNSLKQLGYPHIAVQLVDPEGDFTLHTWYHAVSSTAPVAELYALIEQIEGVSLTPFSADDWPEAFADPRTICYFIDREENAQLLQVDDVERKSELMNAVVNCYTIWGEVERTLLTDNGRLLGQFPNMASIAIFPQFKPEEVFSVAEHHRLLPAGLTRFVIPGRILHLNIPLSLLASEEPLAFKRTWLNDFLSDKLARSRVRYYQEPVILIDA